ncbi:MAG TPA: geranylgeranylglycerol-phosphate geranylgeranyltransferase [Flavobacterium sp.]|nr:geranylgeranylglycerol-phosphate geranylgeranyltransferase [Flavobacterium sp.]
MLSRKNQLLLLKTFSIFSVVRGYNIAVVVLAQYLASIFIFADDKRALDVVLDWRLFLLVLSTSLAIASGYIINNFYDSEKDLINRPNKSVLDRLVSRTTQFRIYFLMNFLSVALAWIVSLRAAIFFSLYIFVLWFYSHKLKKYPIVGNIIATLLVMVPFFAILIHFQNYSPAIFLHGAYLFLLLFIRELIKDLENLVGDLANNYQTIAVKYGVQTSKIILTSLIVLSWIPAYILVKDYHLGYMSYYFYFTCIFELVLGIFVWSANSVKSYRNIHNFLKLTIVLGVISIALIDPKVIIHGKELIQQLPD